MKYISPLLTTTDRTTGVKYNVSHFNAALRVQLENNASFDSTAFLNEMESAGVVPNRVSGALRLVEL